jgi:hypothetical protein
VTGAGLVAEAQAAALVHEHDDRRIVAGAGALGLGGLGQGELQGGLLLEGRGDDQEDHHHDEHINERHDD